MLITEKATNHPVLLFC